MADFAAFQHMKIDQIAMQHKFYNKPRFASSVKAFWNLETLYCEL